MLEFDSKLCTGCRVCELICLQAHYMGTDEDTSRIKISSQWPETESAAVCRQCEEPKCVEACPTGAIEKQDGVITIDASLCTQCSICFEVCEYQAKVFDKQGLPIFCDTCGGKYQCAQMCPSKALKRGVK